MAFGDLIPNSAAGAINANTQAVNAISINGGTGVTVALGDLIVLVGAQQTTNTFTGGSDNLGNTYTAQNAGTISGNTGGRFFYSVVTVAGTLTTVNMLAGAVSNARAVAAAAFSGPFAASPVDISPANTSGDLTSPFTCTATGTLSQASELVIGWSANNINATWAAGTGFTLTTQATRSNAHSAVCHLAVSSTATQTPSFTGTNPASNILGTITFKADTAERITVDSATVSLSPQTIASVDVEVLDAATLAFSGSDIISREETIVPIDSANLSFVGSTILEAEIIAITSVSLSLAPQDIIVTEVSAGLPTHTMLLVA
jgi:hypothetical protein